MTLEPLILKMISYDHGCPERIQHFLKVHSFAKTIAVSEHLDEKTLFITETAAIRCTISASGCVWKNTETETENCRKKKVLPWRADALRAGI